VKRRTFLHQLGGLAWSSRLPALAAAPPAQAPAVITSDRHRPVIDAGVAAGAARDGAIIWAHVDRPSRMLVEHSTSPSFSNVRRSRGSVANPANGLTARARIDGFPPGQDIFYRVRFEDGGGRALSEPVTGHFRSAPATGRPARIAWSADVCGQGWGIDPARGGMQLFKTMAEARPDLFVHVGDTIYADGPLRDEVILDDGTRWKNIVTPAKSKVAESLDEYRGNHLYNRLDEHYRRFEAEVAQVVIWDDHEVRDNWFHAQTLEADPRYTETRVAVLAERARQAFLEYYPVTIDRSARARIYRSIPFGPLIEIFALDMRSYRGANSDNLQTTIGRDTALLGGAQLRWLADALSASTAVWKVIAADMPLGVVVAHQQGRHEAAANGDHGPARGRELEIASLLRTLQARRVRNVVWITGDVHYCAAHHFHPERAATRDFDPFWEFVAGPAHAGTFAPGALDATFGPEVTFTGVPAGLKPNRPPDAGLQFFGLLDAAPDTRQLTVSIVNTAGRRIFEQVLEPSR
jgi:alkaline phosphatase D